MSEAKHTPGQELPFYRLSAEEPMYCVCDHSDANERDFCKKCPHRAEHREAARRELAERIAKAAEGDKKESEHGD